MSFLNNKSSGFRFSLSSMIANSLYLGFGLLPKEVIWICQLCHIFFFFLLLSKILLTKLINQEYNQHNNWKLKHCCSSILLKLSNFSRYNKTLPKSLFFYHNRRQTTLVKQPLDEPGTLSDPLCSTFATVVSSVGTKCSVLNCCWVPMPKWNQWVSEKDRVPVGEGLSNLNRDSSEVLK